MCNICDMFWIMYDINVIVGKNYFCDELINECLILKTKCLCS